VAAENYIPMNTKPAPTNPSEMPADSTPVADVAPEAWEEFLEEEGDCCGGCHHKPR
jgi:hypothetical protein